MKLLSVEFAFQFGLNMCHEQWRNYELKFVLTIFSVI